MCFGPIQECEINELTDQACDLNAIEMRFE